MPRTTHAIADENPRVAAVAETNTRLATTVRAPNTTPRPPITRCGFDLIPPAMYRLTTVSPIATANVSVAAVGAPNACVAGGRRSERLRRHDQESASHRQRQVGDETNAHYNTPLVRDLHHAPTLAGGRVTPRRPGGKS